MKRARSLKIHIMLKLFSLLADVGHTIDTFIFRPHIISAHIVQISGCIELWNADYGRILFLWKSRILVIHMVAKLFGFPAPLLGIAKSINFHFPTCAIGYKGRMAATGASNGQ